MNDKYLLKLYDTSSNTKFPNQNLDLWLAYEEFESFKKRFSKSDSAPIYVTIKSNEPLKTFTVHTRLQSLNQHSDLKKDNVYISKDIRHSDWLMEDGTSIFITPVEESELVEANAITVKLNKSEVENWSEEEVSFAANNFKVHNRIAYKNQKIWINPSTKKASLAEVVSTIPSPKKELNSPLLITENTKIIFDGLPEHQQTVIDFNKIGGLTNVINKLREIIQIPIKYPEVLQHFEVKPPKGLLLYGPPGNGKTLIARAVSHSMGAKFISIEGPELMSKYVGVAENQLREKFEEAGKLGDCVIFIDEIDSIASNREKSSAEHNISIVATLLNLMDGIRPSNKVFVIGATNRLNSVDPALRRPGRFDLEFEIPIPNLSARLDILSKYIDVKNKKIADNSVNEPFLKVLSEITNGFSGADISSLYRESVMNAVRDELQFEEKTGKVFLKSTPDNIKLSQKHFLSAVKSITPTALRGIDTLRNEVAWEDLIGVQKQKRDLAALHRLVSKNMETYINQRPAFFNLLLKGKPGSGRKTLVNSFAKKFNYELLFIDLFNLAPKPLDNAFNEIEEIFIKAKQIAPSIIYIQHTQNFASETLVRKIFSETAKYNLHNKVLIIGEVDTSLPVPVYLLGHKAFSKEMVLDNELSKNTFNEICEIYPNYIVSTFDEFLSKYKDAPIGQIISELNDQQLEAY